MGVTVHYTLITHDPATIIRACRTVVEEAKRAGYRCEELRGEASEHPESRQTTLDEFQFPKEGGDGEDEE